MTDAEMEKIKTYLVNPVESRVASMEKPESLDMKADVPANVARVTGFTQWDDEKMRAYFDSMGFAMSFEDLLFCRDYFRDEEKRDPTVTELRVIDTYSERPLPPHHVFDPAAFPSRWKRATLPRR